MCNSHNSSSGLIWHHEGIPQLCHTYHATTRLLWVADTVHITLMKLMTTVTK